MRGKDLGRRTVRLVTFQRQTEIEAGGIDPGNFPLYFSDKVHVSVISEVLVPWKFRLRKFDYRTRESVDDCELCVRSVAGCREDV